MQKIERAPTTLLGLVIKLGGMGRVHQLFLRHFIKIAEHLEVDADDFLSTQKNGKLAKGAVHTALFRLTYMYNQEFQADAFGLERSTAHSRINYFHNSSKKGKGPLLDKIRTIKSLQL